MLNPVTQRQRTPVTAETDWHKQRRVWRDANDPRINNCRDFKVAITLRVMIANKHWTVIDAPILRPAPSPCVLQCRLRLSVAVRPGLGEKLLTQQSTSGRLSDGMRRRQL